MNILTSTLKFVLIDIIGDFLYWPIWWYTVGLKDRLISSALQIKKTWASLGLGIWIKNIFTPMYADRSFAGRLISFFARIIILTWRLIWFFFWSIFILLFLAIWILAPIAIVWMIIHHFNPNS